MKKKQPIAQHMPETWSLALSMLHKNPKNPFPLTRERIRAASGCGSDVLTALHRMGAIREFEYRGKMYPTLDENVTVPTPVAIREKIREMNERRDKDTINALQEAINNRERHEADTHPLSPTFLGRTPEAGSLSAAIAVITAAGGTVVFGDIKQ